MTAGLTLTITRLRPWRVRQSELEADRMALHVDRIGECPTRCATCAFRPGTDANGSQLVLHLVESCLADESNTFMCHSGLADDEDSHRPCAGFVALRAALGDPS